MNRKTKYLMIQGTGSHVGKSVIVAALCRIFSNRGYRVAPFKAQNMALNSMVTEDGCEVGRSTALQALAARAELKVEMNPVLVKAKDGKTAQVILNGKPYGDFTARESFSKNRELREIKTSLIRDSLNRLSKEFELIIMEGAGSPAEVNLREFDVVNMDVALHTGAPVVIVGDIEPGGLIASLVGTHQLLSEEEKTRVKGFIVNKFRGDKELLEPGLKIIHDITGWDPLGVIPYRISIDLMEEDRLPDYCFESEPVEIDIAVVRHRHLSNFTDLDPFKLEPKLRLRYISGPSELGRPDGIIIPGSKNTISDLKDHTDSGLARKIVKLAQTGIPLFGICAGYQMLGRKLIDPYRLESRIGTFEGFGLLDLNTTFHEGKTTRPRRVRPAGEHGFWGLSPGTELSGYEIHSGIICPAEEAPPPLFVGPDGRGREGMMADGGLVCGTSLHGIFDNDLFRRGFVNFLRKQKGLGPLSGEIRSFPAYFDEKLEEWASFIEKNVETGELNKYF